MNTSDIQKFGEVFVSTGVGSGMGTGASIIPWDETCLLLIACLGVSVGSGGATLTARRGICFSGRANRGVRSTSECSSCMILRNREAGRSPPKALFIGKLSSRPVQTTQVYKGEYPQNQASRNSSEVPVFPARARLGIPAWMPVPYCTTS